MTDSATSTVLQIDSLTMRLIKPSNLDALASIWADPKLTTFLSSGGFCIFRENTQKSLQYFIEYCSNEVKEFVHKHYKNE